MCCRARSALRVTLAFAILAAVHADRGGAPAFAQSLRPAGSFSLLAERSDDIEQAIEAGTAELNFIKRPIARGRLKRVNAAYETIEIERTATAVAVAFDGHPAIVTPASGTPIEWERGDGEVFRVRTDWIDASLRQIFVADDGQRENLFTLGPDGSTLRLRVTITSGRLPAPIVYTLVYRRVE